MHQPNRPRWLKLLSEALRKVPARTREGKEIRTGIALAGSSSRAPDLIFVHVAFETVDPNVRPLARLQEIATFVSRECVKNR